jgi:hypothetical protein
MKKPIQPTKLGRFDKIINFLAFLFLGCQICLALYSMYDLPAIIPIHFDAGGNADSYGNKETLLILPVLSVIIFFFIQYLSKHPHWFNYPVKITEHNAEKQYSNATAMLRILKMSITLIFLLVVTGSYLAGSGRVSKLPAILLPLLIFLAIAPTVYYLIKAFQSSKP